MTIDEAIKYSEEGANYLHSDHLLIQERAVRLGVEALMAYKFFRAQDLQTLLPKLPGETEE